MVQAHADVLWELLHGMESGPYKYGVDPAADARYAQAVRAMSDDHALYDAVIAKFMEPRLDHDTFVLLATRESRSAVDQLQAADVMLATMTKCMYQAAWNVRQQVQSTFHQDVPQVFVTLAASLPYRDDRVGAYRAAAFMSFIQGDPELVFKNHLNRLWDARPADEMRKTLSVAFSQQILPEYMRVTSEATLNHVHDVVDHALPSRTRK